MSRGAKEVPLCAKNFKRVHEVALIEVASKCQRVAMKGKENHGANNQCFITTFKPNSARKFLQPEKLVVIAPLKSFLNHIFVRED